MKAAPALLLAPLFLAVAVPAVAQPMPVTRNAVERRAAQMFTAADLDRDGWLTRAEYRTAVVRQAQRFDPNVPTEGKGMDAAMAQFDVIAKSHPDDRIPRNEFVTAATAHFDGADLNHDGTVTPEEAREAGAIKQRALTPPKPRKKKK